MRYDFILIRFDFKVRLIITFHWINWFSKFIFFMHILMQDHDNTLVLYVPHQKKSFAQYIWRRYSRWQIALIPVVSSSGMTYANVGSVPTEKHNIYDIHYHLSPTHLTLCGQRCICYKNVFMSCGSGHKTFLGLYLS
jgi:hypothetical protein